MKKLNKKQYGVGGTISALSPLLNLAVPGLGIATDMIGQVLKQNSQQKQQQDLLSQQNRKNAIGLADASQSTLTPGYLAPFAVGGTSPGTDVEVEEGEVLRNPQTGSLAKISEGAPSHAQGGVDISAEPGTQIYGKLKVKEGRFKGMSYKDAADKIRKEIARLEKN
jgi:hypothetical protein